MIALPECARARRAGLTSLLLLGLALPGLAQTFRIDDEGGPLTLSEDAAAAAAAWNASTEQAEIALSADADTVIGFADPTRLGPDLVSATVVRTGDEPLEIWLHPDLYRDFPQALLHEFGLLLGLPAVTTEQTSAPAAPAPANEAGLEPAPAAAEGYRGVMVAQLAQDGPTAPTADDLEALASLRGRETGDLNGDGQVGLADLALLGRAYGERGVNLAADLDGNGVVDAGDVEVIRGLYEFSDPSAGGTGQTEDGPGDAGTTPEEEQEGDVAGEAAEEPLDEPLDEPLEAPDEASPQAPAEPAGDDPEDSETEESEAPEVDEAEDVAEEEDAEAGEEQDSEEPDDAQ